VWRAVRSGSILAVSVLDLSPGALFAGDFEIVRKLGAGGMGAVYVVEQRSTGRRRALKLMLPGTVERAELRAKFELEARVGARIKSEHVVEVVSAGVDDKSGAPWLAMELLDGDDLSAAIARSGPMSPAETLDVMEQVCHALAAAHDVGVVHRDLKPENVFMATSRRTTSATTVKVLDFGIAKVVEEARATNTGALGTPFWMSPEQTERNAKIGPTADVWAIGLLAYFLLVGKPFWLSAEGERQSVHAFLRELLFDDIPLASARAAEQGAAALPAGFDGWFASCLERSPDTRLADARAAFDALAPVLRGEGVDARAAVAAPREIVRVATPAPSEEPDHVVGAAKTVALEAEDDLVGPPSGLPRRSGPTVAIVGVALVVLVGGGGAIALRRPVAATSPSSSPSPSSGVAKKVLACPKGMRDVAAARYKMGDDDNAQREVDVPDLCVDTTEVTVDEYGACVEGGACGAPKAEATWANITHEDRQRFSPYCNWAKPERFEHPMNCVTLDEARAFCAWGRKRLPTEAEWERVARGDDRRAYPWGAEAPSASRVNACDVACAVKRSAGSTLASPITFDDTFPSTSPVGALPEGANTFGLFDLAGNVAEWTDSPFCPIATPKCESSTQVIRGGSWMSDVVFALRVTARDKIAPLTRTPDVGFRCVR
jgi:serine/threonine protein kinase/formylglycine-generating enzyme required for sulfatase activity